MNRRCRSLLLFALAIPLLLSGCGGRGVEQVKVTGRVTLDGGAMPGPGTLFFSPVEAAGGQPLRPGSAEFGADGQYAAGAFEKGDGLLPGAYRVAVHCWEKVSTSEERDDSKSFLPQKYGDPEASGLTLVVEPGAGSMTQDFDLQSTE